MKLRAKLLLLFFALAVLPMAGVGVLSYYNSLRTVEEVVEIRNLNAAREGADTLSKLVTQRQDETTLLAQNQEIQNFYAQLPDAVPQRLQTFYGQFFQGPRQAFIQLQYLDLDGNLILRYNGLATDPTGNARPTLTRTDTTFTYLNLGPYQEDRLHVENAYLQTHGPVLRCGRWIKSIADGRRIGFLLADLSIAQLVAATPIGQRTLPRASAILFERAEGRILYHPEAHLIGEHIDQTVSQGGELFAQILQDSTGQARDRLNEHLLSYVDLDRAHWTVGIFTHVMAHTVPARRAGLINLGIALGCALLILILTPLVVGRVTRSIHRVTEGAEAIAAGDLDQQITVDSHDETRTLADAFNRMAASLKQHLAELEDRVKERTAELATANDRLAAQNRDLTVEQALERVRTEVAAMQQSDDLHKVGKVVEEALVELGVPCNEVGINTVDEEARVKRSYSPNNLYGDGRENILDKVYFDHWKKGETFIRSTTPESLSDRYQQGIDTGDFAGTEDERETVRAIMQRITEQGGEVWIVDVPFTHGALAMNKFGAEPFADDHVHLLERFTEVFALGYRRYLDLEAAEARTRQAELERAVERVRSAAMAMDSSDDLGHVIRVLFGELDRLRVDAPRAGIYFVDEAAGLLDCWLALANEHQGLDWSQSPMLVSIDQSAVVSRFSTPISADLVQRQMRAWRSGEVTTGEVEFTREDLQEGWKEQGIRGTRETLDRVADAIAGNWQDTQVPFAHGTISYFERATVTANVDIVRALASALELGYRRFLDFQRLEAQNQQLQEANEQIQEATRHKSQFLARMSHDLRTPMNAIIGYTRILIRRVKDQLDPRQFQNLENIQLSANNLLILINDILDLSRIESGRVDLKPEAVDLPQLIDECAASVESLLKPGVELKRQVDAPATLTTDADLLRRIVMNLLGNAVKFTEAGRITLSLSAQNGGVQLAITDTGVGIPPEDLPYIFEEFRQVDGQGDVKVQEGSGLGLAIVRKSVELLGGTIEAESTVGQGTTFTLQLDHYRQ